MRFRKSKQYETRIINIDVIQRIRKFISHQQKEKLCYRYTVTNQMQLLQNELTDSLLQIPY